MLTDKEIRKSTKSPTGSDVSKIRLDNFYSRPISTIPENFMKIRPRISEKSSKKNNNNNQNSFWSPNKKIGLFDLKDLEKISKKYLPKKIILKLKKTKL